MAIELLLELGLPGDRLAVDFDDRVAGLQAGFGGRRVWRGKRRSRRAASKDRRPLHADSQHAGVQIVVRRPVAAARFARSTAARRNRCPSRTTRRRPPCWSIGRQRDQHAQHAAGDVDQRPAIIGGRDFGVGLNRPAPNAVERADDADRHVRRVGVDSVRPTAMAHWPTRISLGRHRFGHGQRRRRVEPTAAPASGCDRWPPAWRAAACRRPA